MKGKAGDHKPLDPAEDFDKPVKKPEQLAMDAGNQESDQPQPIQHGKMLAQFVQVVMEKEEDGTRYLGFEFSFPLTLQHEKDGHLPGEVVDEWKHIRKSGATLVRFEVPPQTIAVGLVPDNKEDDLMLVAAEIRRPTLDVVEETGSGKTQKVVRFKFRAFVEADKKFWDFTFNHFGESVWLSLKKTQASLLE